MISFFIHLKKYLNLEILKGATPPFYLAQPTSYDYDAPLSESGDITQKYLAIRKSISKYLPIPNVTVPFNQTKFAYGKIPMTYVIIRFYKYAFCWIACYEFIFVNETTSKCL